MLRLVVPLILFCSAWALRSPSPGPPYSDAASRAAATPAIGTAGLPALVETRQHDSLGRLTHIGTASGHHNYTYDRDHQRTRVDLADGSHWEYEYDAKGQLVGGTKFDPAGNEVPSQSYSYIYDDIGNRTEATEGLSEPALHSPNALNQYSQRAVPSTVGVLGRADPAAAVAVNGVLAARSGVHFSRPLGVDNTSNAVWQTVDTIAAKPAGPGQPPDPPHDLFAAETGALFVARNPETFVHDADGNLLQDGRWDYQWNADNRLVRMETRADLPAEVPRLLLEFGYDHMGRRFRKKVTWPATGATETTLYHYDGWNLVHEEIEDAPARSYVWGLDLSGSLQGAGGVGGLQWAVNHVTGETHAPEYDGNGNIVRWTALAGVAESFADFGYAPFGGELVSFQNRPDIPFGFSTKYRDAETGFLYYGYRYYNPQTGRWLNRDPIGEAGGLNVNAFIANNPLNSFDAFGLAGKQALNAPRAILRASMRLTESYVKQASEALPKLIYNNGRDAYKYLSVTRCKETGELIKGWRTIPFPRLKSDHLGPAFLLPGHTATVRELAESHDHLAKYLRRLAKEFGESHADAFASKRIGINEAGLIDFSEVVIRTSRGDPIEVGLRLTGKSSADIAAADTKAAEMFGMGVREFVEHRNAYDWTWHHHPDMHTMQLVPRAVNALPHIGGESLARSARHLGLIDDSYIRNIVKTGVSLRYFVLAPRCAEEGIDVSNIIVDIGDLVDPTVIGVATVDFSVNIAADISVHTHEIYLNYKDAMKAQERAAKLTAGDPDDTLPLIYNLKPTQRRMHNAE